MKALFVTHKESDYISSCLWDGLQELLGEDNVYDAVNCPYLHASNLPNPSRSISALRPGRTIYHDRNLQCDLMVLNACFLRDFDGHLAVNLKNQFLKPHSKIAYVEGWDSDREIHWMDEIGVAPYAVFRRELNPKVRYPYTCRCLMMSAPMRWFSEAVYRPIDVFYTAQCNISDPRWDSLNQIFATQTRHKSLIGSYGVSTDRYFEYLSQAKLAVCPIGAAGCFDCLRTWEAVACGAIPIFVGWPDRIRNPWFADDEIFWCHEARQLPGIIDRALGMDLNAMRIKMQANAKQNHTTMARAKRLLDIIGLS
jgi:hypothetical protein